VPDWLQLLTVCTLVTVCALYSCAILLPRAAKGGIARLLARQLRGQPGATHTGLISSLRTALEAYAARQATGGGCGGCGSCPPPPPAAKTAPQPTAQPVRWHQRDQHK